MDRDFVYYEFTNSLCNECLKVISAKIIFKDNKVYLVSSKGASFSSAIG